MHFSRSHNSLVSPSLCRGSLGAAWLCHTGLRNPASLPCITTAGQTAPVSLRAPPALGPSLFPMGGRCVSLGALRHPPLPRKESGRDARRNLTWDSELAAAPPAFPDKMVPQWQVSSDTLFWEEGLSSVCMWKGNLLPRASGQGSRKPGYLASFQSLKSLLFSSCKTPDVSSSQRPASRFLNAWPHSFTHHSLPYSTIIFIMALQCVRHQGTG